MTTPNIKALAERTIQVYEQSSEVLKKNNIKSSPANEVIFATALLRVLEDAERMDTALHGVAYYYVSANGVPVERATIRADSSEIKALMEALESHNKLMEELNERNT